MKKVFSLVLLLLCCCSFSSLKTIRYKTYAVAYFENLTNNFPYNYRGSCGYVSMCMLLSYYDSYLSDNVVHEYFDVNSTSDGSYVPGVNDSPGVRQDFLSNGYNCTNQEYINMIEHNKQTSLHSYLLSLGRSQGYYFTNINGIQTYGLTLSNEKHLFEIYFTPKKSFGGTNSSVSIDTYSSIEYDTRKKTIDIIQSGRPVMISINGTYKHSVIAYDYDVEKDIIYCHPGYHGYNTHMDINEIGLGNVSIDYVIDLNFHNIKHTHNDNYIIFSDGSSEYYCSCSPAIGLNYLFN